ncbi:MAG: ImmA/IrrE family metallo-endopeptidase [Planctomycetes bacterium]|nr:ImmA/IrrE family metallo-endopeptidase [Planctomycetota bacterium]
MVTKATRAATTILSDKGQGDRFPTDLDALLARESVVVEFFTTSRRFEGCTKLVANRPAIFVNDRSRGRSDGRVRFTFAHEIGHFFLHRKLLRQGREFADKSIDESGERGDALEREANAFASEVLLPTKLIRQFLSRSIISLESIKKLSTTAQTSLQATSIRVARESSSRFCVFFERDGQILWSAPSDDWRHAKLPWSKWHGQELPAASNLRKEGGDVVEREVPRRVWHPNDRDDGAVAFEAALETPFGRLMLVIDGASDYFEAS